MLPNARALLQAGLVAGAVALFTGCGGGATNGAQGAAPSSPTNTPSPPNAVPIVVDGAGPSINKAFVTVTLCVPGTQSCATIDHIAVDTGSFGLRVASALAPSLPVESRSTGQVVFECAQFVTSYDWGPLALADVKIGGEQVRNFPVQLVQTTPGPSNCSQGPNGTLTNLGTNGVGNGILGLGVGIDCGQRCATSANFPFYLCNAAVNPTSCSFGAVDVPQQPQIPVPLFNSSDTNGFLIDMPAIPASGATIPVTGSLIFGVNTTANNHMSTETAFTFPMKGTYAGSTYFAGIDSGTPLNLILTPALTGIPPCSSNPSEYCPSAPTTFSFVISAANGGTESLGLPIAGSWPVGTFASGNAAEASTITGNATPYILLGMPFFYGRRVFYGIEPLAQTNNIPQSSFVAF